MTPDEAVLADAGEMALRDTGGMLPATASAGAQIRMALAGDRSGFAQVSAEGRPRSIVVTGMGGSGISGDVLAAVLGVGAPIPVHTVRGYRLPGWVGPLDLVIPVSCSGRTEETLAVAGSAATRGARLIGVGAASSPLADVCAQARAPFVAVDAQGRMPRASLWTLAVPLLQLAAALDLLELPDVVLEQAADRLDEIAVDYGPSVEPGLNLAKDLAIDLATSSPVVWGTGDVGSVAAYRLACQLNENAKQSVAFGTLPEANHNQVVAFDSVVGERDIFADPATDAGPRLILIRDAEEHPQVAARAAISREIAEDRGIPVTVLQAEPGHPLLRLVSLIGPLDFASVYAAFVRGVDPYPIEPINELKARLAR